jgi:MFS family permease
VVGSGIMAISTCFAAAAIAMATAAVVAGAMLPDDRDAELDHVALSLQQFLDVTRRLPWVVLLGVLTGALDSAAWSLLTPYLRTAGFADATAMFALSIFLWGQVVLLLPLGVLADRTGERRLLRGLSVFIVIYCVALTQAAQLGSTTILVLTFLFGPACFSIYGAALSLAGKLVDREQLAVASASLVTGWCLGGFVGSIAIGIGMDLLDARVFPLTLLAVATGIALVVTRGMPKVEQGGGGLDEFAESALSHADTALAPAPRAAILETRRARGAHANAERGSYQASTRSPSRASSGGMQGTGTHDH